MPKLYSKNTWVDEVLADDERYDILEDDGTPISEDVQIALATAVTTAGSPVNAARMNNIEEGIDDLDDALLEVITTLDVPNLTEKTTPVDNDMFLMFDSEASNAPKKIKGVNMPGSGGGGSGGDLLSELLSAEVSVTGAVTLTLGKMHLISDSGTPADYTVTLPAASGNAGKFVGIRIAKDATKLFTVDGNGSEEIDGQTTRVMWAKETAILMCDGTGWTKIAGKSIPMMCRLEYQGTEITYGTLQQLQFDTEIFDVGDLGDTANDRIVARRAGKMRVFAQCRWYSGTANRSYILLRLGGTATMSDERYASSTAISSIISTVVQVTAGMAIDFYCYTSTARKIYSQVGTEYTSFVAEEIIEW